MTHAVLLSSELLRCRRQTERFFYEVLKNEKKQCQCASDPESGATCLT